MTSREKEIQIIKEANRASAVGLLLLGKLNSWQDFFQADSGFLASLPRRMLKSGKKDVRSRLSKEINMFCSQNFVDMNPRTLATLYEDIKARRGFEIPLEDFEKKYAKIKPSTLKGHPAHSTVVISLWGLQFKFPEDMIAADIMESLSLIRDSEKILSQYEHSSHAMVKTDRERVSSALRLSLFSSRACLLSCFNLVEAFFNGLAWEFSRDPNNMLGASEKKKKLLQDGTIREKILKYPEIISGDKLWDEKDTLIRAFLETVKPFRDSLVHPSPFSAPERYGGRDKLEHLYRVNLEKAEEAARISVGIIIKMFTHVKGNRNSLPVWLEDLRKVVFI